MIRKEFVEYLSDKLGIERKDLIEKDIILQLLLKEMGGNDFFRNNFAFKGGTCLIKCYLGYYRFSEDLDFTYINQKEFEKKSQKTVRKIISRKIEIIMDMLKVASEKLGLDFKPEKNNKRYFEFGGSNKFTTFKLWYNSDMLGRESFIKIQINFVELILFPIIKSKVKTIISKIDAKELKFLFPEYSSLLFDLNINIYKIKEILVEKVRAILTRKGIKARDFIDVFLIIKKGVRLESFEKEILSKIRFMLKYQKYINNLEGFNIQKFVLGEEEKLLLKPIGKDFEGFIEKFIVYLNKIAREAKE